jgi:hypothetical protein
VRYNRCVTTHASHNYAPMHAARDSDIADIVADQTTDRRRELT